MTDIILAAGGALARDLSPVAIVARSLGPEASGAVPRQEWLGAKAAAGGAPIRLVGHKVLAQGAGKTPRRPAAATSDSADPRSNLEMTEAPLSSAGSLDVYTAAPDRASYATRAIAIFSQQLSGYTGAKGTRIDTYA
jgi:hypothetical protein